MADGKNPEDRLAYFGCKNCGAINQQPFPEVRVIAQKEPCKCGITDDSRTHRYWATAGGIAASILILSVFGSCAADHYFTTEQIKALPKGYTVQKVHQGDGLGPEFKVRELTPAEKDRQALLDTIEKLQKEVEEKGKR